MEKLINLHDKNNNDLFTLYKQCEFDKDKIVSFFLASLSSRNLLWRSFLSAFAIMQTYPKHYYKPMFNDDPHGICKVCSEMEYYGFKINEDYLSVLKQVEGGGGIATPNIRYYIVILNEFIKVKESRITPTEIDIEIFSRIMEVITSANIEHTLKKELLKQIGIIPNFKSNSYERKVLLETLGFCSILETTKYKGLLYTYVNLPYTPKKTRNSDWNYPVDFWSVTDGINKEAFKFWFGSYPQLDKYWK